MNTIRTVIAVVAVVVCVLPTTFTYAQLIQTLVGRPLEITLSPRTPAPHQTVFVTLSSYSLDLERTYIQWYTNGVLSAEGSALDSFSFTAGDTGSETEVAAVVQTADGTQTNASVVIRPAFVTIAWEAVSYTPPFYQGRALPAADARITATAITSFVTQNGTRIPQEDIVYTWRLDGRIVSSLSGRGRAAASFAGPQLYGSQTLAVEAVSIDYRYQASASARIEAVEPQPTLYPELPLNGIAYHRALTSGTETPEAELSVVLEPYYFSTDAALTYSWQVNGTPVVGGVSAPSRLTIAANEAQEGLIELTVRHRTHALQAAKRSWLLRFGTSNATNDPFNLNPFR